jgi:hypothetical protein
MSSMIPKQLVGPLCLLGFCVFAAGVSGGSYMMLKTQDWTMAALDKYQRGRYQPRWPVGCVYVCLPLGILIVFGVILAS